MTTLFRRKNRMNLGPRVGCRIDGVTLVILVLLALYAVYA
jgi:hypothetical protein